MKILIILIALMLPVLPALAVQQTLISASDPPGDDHGAGALVYPQRDDFQAGDLDLLLLKISRDEEGFWFEAMFRNPVRDPGSVAGAEGNEPLANFARKGFYQFNMDVYIDTDRIRGSGNTLTLPGRHAQIDSAYAWEKAVILTPRPELMRQQLLDALIEQYPSLTEAEASIDKSIFFPTRIRVRGKSITYFVPANFFPGSDGTDWAITSLVTGALINIPADLSLLPSTIKPLDRLQLGVMQPVIGKPRNTFGYSGAVPSPVVDMLNTSTEQQARQLAAQVAITGASWGPHAVDDAQAAAAAGNAFEAEQKPDKEQSESFDRMFLPRNHVASMLPEEKNGDTTQGNLSIARRLQTLKQLLDQKLIDEAEYRQQKQRILNDL